MNEKLFHVPETLDSLLTTAVRNVPCNLTEPWLNKIHCGDCIELMNQMPVESVDLCVTSPPYNLRNSTGNGMKNGNGGKWKNAALINGYSGHDDCMPHGEYVEWQRNYLTLKLSRCYSGSQLWKPLHYG